MQLYVVIIEDRHIDVEVELFTSRENAVAFAKETALEIATRYGDHPERQPTEETIDGWLYAARCSSESDYVRVVEKTLNKEE